MMRMLWVTAGMCALYCTKSNPERLSMCDKCQLTSYTDCIHMHTCDKVTVA